MKKNNLPGYVADSTLLINIIYSVEMKISPCYCGPGSKKTVYGGEILLCGGVKHTGNSCDRSELSLLIIHGGRI